MEGKGAKLFEGGLLRMWKGKEERKKRERVIRKNNRVNMSKVHHVHTWEWQRFYLSLLWIINIGFNKKDINIGETHYRHLD